MASTSHAVGQVDQRKDDDRRSGRDRRKVNLGPPPPGPERRKGERRRGADRRKNA